MTIRTVEVRPGVSFQMDLGYSAQAANIGWYLDRNLLPEMELMHVLMRAIKPGDFAVDCGACTGFFSCAMAALGARVLAIEPGENNLPELRANVAVNNFDITVRPIALGGAQETRDFLLIDDGGANSFTQPADRHPGRLVTVPVYPLSFVVGQHPKLIKMDIEGSEFEVLYEWVQSQWRCPFIVIELNLEALRRAGRIGIEIIDLMRGHGYEMFILFSDGVMPMWLPPGVDLICSRQNTDVLFCRPEDLRQLWPELKV